MVTESGPVYSGEASVSLLEVVLLGVKSEVLASNVGSTVNSHWLLVSCCLFSPIGNAAAVQFVQSCCTLVILSLPVALHPFVTGSQRPPRLPKLLLLHINMLHQQLSLQAKPASVAVPAPSESEHGRRELLCKSGIGISANRSSASLPSPPMESRRQVGFGFISSSISRLLLSLQLWLSSKAGRMVLG